MTAIGPVTVASGSVLAPATTAVAAGPSSTAATAMALPERVDSDLRISMPTSVGSDGPVRRTGGRRPAGPADGRPRAGGGGGGGTGDGRGHVCGLLFGRRDEGRVVGRGHHAAAVSWKKRSSRPRCSGRRSVNAIPADAASAPTTAGSAPSTTR